MGQDRQKTGLKECFFSVPMLCELDLCKHLNTITAYSNTRFLLLMQSLAQLPFKYDS